MFKNGQYKFGSVKRYNYGDIVIFKIQGKYIQGKIIAVFASFYMIISDDIKDGRWDDGIFRVGISEVERIREYKKVKYA